MMNYKISPAAQGEVKSSQEPKFDNDEYIEVETEDIDLSDPYLSKDQYRDSSSAGDAVVNNYSTNNLHKSSRYDNPSGLYDHSDVN